jgi:anthranilate synthase component 1
MNLTFEQFSALAASCNLIPLCDDLPADLDTPVSAFLKLRTGEYDFLFESVVGGEKWARYSFLGTQPRTVYALTGGRLQAYDVAAQKFEEIPFSGNPLDVFRSRFKALRPYQDPGLPRFFGGLVGYLSYDTVKRFERVALALPSSNGVPEMCFLETDTVVIFDNLKQVMKVVASVRIPNGADAVALRGIYDAACATVAGIKTKLLSVPAVSFLSKGELSSKTDEKDVVPAVSRADFCAMVEAAKEYILAGDVFQVVLSNRFELDADGIDPFEVYRRLRRVNPSPYMFFLQFQDLKIAGASPEILVRLEDGKIAVRPIAGTRPRGSTDAQDEALERELLADPKELSEHIMLVDLGRNDVGRVAKIGSVRVDEQKAVERYSHVMHLVSHVSGELAEGKDVFDVITAAFPAGTLTGAPKIRAMEIIDELEGSARGIYGGAIGYVSFTGNADLAIAIRTAVFTDDKVVVRAGAGIVASSVPESEYQECVNKAAGMLKAIL